MAGKIVRAAIVGASTLLGKELIQELSSSSIAWDLKLLDAAEAGGQMTSAGDEPVLIQTIEPGAFDSADVVFFAGNMLAGDRETAQKHWKEAQSAGAVIVDCTAALETERGALVRCPWIAAPETGGGGRSNLARQMVVPAHPAAVMLALVLTRLRTQWKSARIIATMMEPASQQGAAGLDELHRQTVALLSFQTLPKDVYDEQVAFNLNAAFGEAAKVNLGAVTARVKRHILSVAGKETSDALALQMLQAPVFNGYTASVFVEIDSEVLQAEVERALQGGRISITEPGEPGPSNLSATEQGQILLQVHAESDGAREKSGFWMWMAADNLKLAAHNAVACTLELVALRPADKLQ